MRLFVAFDVSEEAKEELRRLQSELEKTDAKLNPVKEVHLTLKFLGEVEEDKIEEIKNRLKEIKSGKFTAQLSNTGVFPSENFVRVVWIGLEPKDRINALQQKIEQSLGGLFPKDERFHPHVTLARVKFVKDKKGFIETIKKLRPEKISFEVDSFKLVKSTLTGEGPVYEDLLLVNLT